MKTAPAQLRAARPVWPKVGREVRRAQMKRPGGFCGGKNNSNHGRRTLSDVGSVCRFVLVCGV